jgi:hypothetical protein
VLYAIDLADPMSGIQGAAEIRSTYMIATENKLPTSTDPGAYEVRRAKRRLEKTHGRLSEGRHLATPARVSRIGRA